jgi:hypothetical protein
MPSARELRGFRPCGTDSAATPPPIANPVARAFRVRCCRDAASMWMDTLSGRHP